jgi:hypothetical protein
VEPYDYRRAAQGTAVLICVYFRSWAVIRGDLGNNFIFGPSHFKNNSGRLPPITHNSTSRLNLVTDNPRTGILRRNFISFTVLLVNIQRLMVGRPVNSMAGSGRVIVWTIRVRLPEETTNFLKQRPHRFRCPPNFLSNGYKGLFSRV